ncbi:MAG TPA: ATP-binding cassette domain-containing protein [Pirellulales bacterium]
MSHIEICELTKQYGQLMALDKCTFSVGAGEVFGLLGPNGSGKSTLLRLLMGYLRPTRGRATIANRDCYRESVAVHRGVSYLPGDVRLFRRMSGRDVLDFIFKLRGQRDPSHSIQLAQRLGLDLSRRVAQMSTGMRQKLALSAVLAVDTPLLVLDEPTSNLDPTVRATIASMIREAKNAGRTVIFSSHVLSEVEQVCDRVVILREGRLVHAQILAEIRRRHRIQARLSAPFPPVPPQLQEQLVILPGKNETVTIETAGELSPLLGWLATLPVREVRIEPLGLQAVYEQYHPAENAA